MHIFHKGAYQTLTVLSYYRYKFDMLLLRLDFVVHTYIYSEYVLIANEM